MTTLIRAAERCERVSDEEANHEEILSGHVSPETAVVVDDYPYGFKLRCKIRYWLRYRPGHGFRFVSQTTNPKRPGEVWNKPKAATYVNGPMVLTRDTSNGYIASSSLHFASATAEQAQDWLDNRSQYLPAEFIPHLARFVKVKREYDRLKANGADYREAALKASLKANGMDVI